MLRFVHDPHPAPVEAGERTRLTLDPGFGRVFTDHMLTMRWSEAAGWHDGRIHPRAPLLLDPATAVLHYAQEIFEGLKGYRLDDGGVALFRPGDNAARFRSSARRLAMPELPGEIFVDSVRQLTLLERDWIPAADGGALYLRPFMIASEAVLGVKPAAEYLYMVVASSVAGYFKSGAPAVSLWVSREHSRAAAGGTGAAKCGGNYAASLLAQRDAIARGCDQVVFLDAAERRWVEELGGMNIFFLFDDGSVATPPLTGTILPGITRASILTMLRDEGVTVREEPYAVEQWRRDAERGRLTETFACGTAAVVTPVGTVRMDEGGFTIGDGGPGRRTVAIRDRLTALQRGRAPDPHGWLDRLA